MQYIKLGNVIQNAKSERCGDREYPVLSITKSDGIVLQSDKFKKRIASQDTDQYKIVYRGQLVQGIHIDEANFGIQDIADLGIVSPAYKIWNVDGSFIIPKYLEEVLRSPRSIHYYSSKFNGSVKRRERLSDRDFLTMEIPCPSINEQEHVLKVIEKVRNIIAARKQEMLKLDGLIEARFVEMFGTYPANEKGWAIGTIRDLVTEVRYGSSRKAADGNSGKYPYLRMNNITYGGELDLTDTKTIDIPDEEIDKCTVRRGDLLFNRTNSKELVGKTCVYNRDEMMVLAGFVVRVRLNNRALPEFVSAFLNTEFSKQMLLNMCKAAIGQANINAQELQNIGIYIPPIELQKEFISFKAQIDKSKVVVQKAFDETKLLFDILMQQYFS